MELEDKGRCTISLPPYHYRRGKLWAWAKGRGLAALVSDVFQARMEANDDLVDRILTDRAQDLGISVEELTQRILNDKDLDEA